MLNNLNLANSAVRNEYESVRRSVICNRLALVFLLISEFSHHVLVDWIPGDLQDDSDPDEDV